VIHINLLPPELRTNGKKLFTLSAKQKKILIAVGAVLAILTVIFYIQYQLSLRALRQLQGKWTTLQKDIVRVSNLQSQLESGDKKEKAFLEHDVTSPLSLTAVLNALNQYLPDSVWLIEIKFARQPKESTFLVRGLSLPSSQHSSIQDVEKYLRDLKQTFPPETELVLTTSRQMKENKELTLFTAIFKWN